MGDRRIRYMKLDDLQGNADNPKGHDLGLIGQSLDRFGLVEPQTLDGRTGLLIAGHGRLDELRAKQDAGEPPPDGVRLRGSRWWVPVVLGWSSANDAEALAYLVASNESTIAGGWDYPRLLPALEQVATTSLELVGTGYTRERLDGILEQIEAGRQFDTAPLDDPDPEREIPKRVTRGDLWQLGPHRLLCGDCRDPADVDRLLDGQAVNVAFTSPPYADRRSYDETSGFEPVHPDAYAEWFAPAVANVAKHLADDGSWFLNIKEHCEDGQRVLYVKDLVLTHVRAWGWMLVDEFCWTRGGVPGGWPNRFKNAWEPVFHFTRRSAVKFRPDAVAIPSADAFEYAPDNPKSATGFFSQRGRPDIAHEGMARPSNVLKIGAESGLTGLHTAPYPVALPSWFIRAFSDVGDVIFDPFVGSGSTILAADQTARLGYGIELSPAYCDIILDRWERHDGETPVKIDT